MVPEAGKNVWQTQPISIVVVDSIPKAIKKVYLCMRSRQQAQF